MANLQVKDGAAATKYLKGTGAGTDVDPFIGEHLDTNSAALLTAAQAIQTAVEIIDNMISGSEAQVDVLTSALPSGATTEATLAAIQTAVELIDNFISGSEGQVDIVASLPAGTNNIGDVDVLTQPARDRLTDNVGAALQTDAIMNDTTALTPKFAIIDAATSGDNTLVAAVAGAKIRVLAYVLVASAAVTVRFEDGAGGTALSGQMQLAANGGAVAPFSPVGWFETTANTLLNLELSGAISVDGHLIYVEV